MHRPDTSASDFLSSGLKKAESAGELDQTGSGILGASRARFDTNGGGNFSLRRLSSFYEHNLGTVLESDAGCHGPYEAPRWDGPPAYCNLT